MDTPHLAMVVQNAGSYRVDVKKDLTVVTVRQGQASVYGQQSAFKIKSGLSCSFAGKYLKNHTCKALPVLSEFDKWVAERDKIYAKSNQSRQVAKGVIGYEDLTQHGSWKSDKKYGKVWIPDQIPDNWAPYRYGQWVWVSSWGWTWVDDQPWGFAPFHYGRWTYVEREWAWVPGPVDVEPLYAPALVAFIGGQNHQLEVAAGQSGVAWFPLGPDDVYIPPYSSNQTYFTEINTTNTIINNTVINRVYNDQSTTINYQNVGVSGAVTAVPQQAFIESQPVDAANVEISPKVIEEAPKGAMLEVAPDETSIQGGNTVAEVQPANDIVDQPAVVKTEPAPAAVQFNEEQKLLNQNPGKPLNEKELQTLQKSSNAQDQIELVSPPEKPQPVQESNAQDPTVNEIDAVKEPPAEVQQAPVEVQEAPADVQEAPADIQEAPADVQEAPADIQEAPADVQQAPADIQEAPADVQQAPADIQEAPADVQEAPADIQEAPADVQQAPADVQEAPADVQQAPADIQEAPADVQETPVDVQEAPADIQEAPADVQQAPAAIQEAPADVQQAPAAIQEAPADVQQAPADIQEAPADVQQAPAAIKEAPAKVKNAPANIEQAPAAVQQSPPDMRQNPANASSPLQNNNQNSAPGLENKPDKNK